MTMTTTKMIVVMKVMIMPVMFMTMMTTPRMSTLTTVLIKVMRAPIKQRNSQSLA